MHLCKAHKSCTLHWVHDSAAFKFFVEDKRLEYKRLIAESSFSRASYLFCIQRWRPSTAKKTTICALPLTSAQRSVLMCTHSEEKTERRRSSSAVIGELTWESSLMPKLRLLFWSTRIEISSPLDMRRMICTNKWTPKRQRSILSMRISRWAFILR